ncbi:hypothetical protein EDF36_2523 [Rathayibacter sp. PhB152]|uniref:hypothetical protein n=1 Tax=Rathayibacter sp. PhB152 TaxID=2485190 RepID=UPI000FC3653D|nr:hypothetical protein [Rathayibacter sp. PhB152]ROQ59065.1 hypothetical protein EDF36_2523 [Rathayibacter sp. PhB152]
MAAYEQMFREQAEWEAEDERRAEVNQARLDVIRDEFKGESFMRLYERARRDFAELGDIIVSWNERASSIRFERGDDMTQVIVEVAEDLPDRAGELVQNILINLQFSLEHLAMALAVHEQGGLTAAQKTGVGFPAALKEEGWVRRRVHLLSESARADVLSLQPYAGTPEAPETHVLALLSELAKTQRHHSELLTTSTTGTQGFSPADGVMLHVSEAHVTGQTVAGIGSAVVLEFANDVDLDNVAVLRHATIRLNVPGLTSDGENAMLLLDHLVGWVLDRVFLLLTPHLR